MNKPKLLESKLVLLALMAILMSSCGTSNSIAYFQDLKDGEKVSEVVTQVSNYEITIQPSDLLSITISSIDPNAVAVFNLPATTFLTPGETALSTTPVLQTYLVSVDGYIDFPVVGKLKVAGLSRSEVSNLIRDKVAIYAKDPLVNIQIMNFKVSVLGEVNRPGAKEIKNERITVLDAISLAEDLTINGLRSNVLLIREIDGQKEFHRFDLTSSDLFNSPYFYLKQNDIIYVEPNKARQGASKIDPNKQFNISVASTITGVVSTIASLCIALFMK